MLVSTHKNPIQRFYTNDQYRSNDPNAPNFLMIGGEGTGKQDFSSETKTFLGPESPKWVTDDYAWVTYAKEVGASLYLLEHRYYGDSKL